MYFRLRVFVLVSTFIYGNLKICCDCRLVFPNEDLYNTSVRTGLNSFNLNNLDETNDNHKWSWRPNGYGFQDGAWKWTQHYDPGRKLQFPDSDEVSTNRASTFDSDAPKWPRSSLYNQIRDSSTSTVNALNRNQLQYAHRYAHSGHKPPHVIRLPLLSPNQRPALPQTLQNYYKMRYGHGYGHGGSSPIASGSDLEPAVEFTPPTHMGWDPEDPALALPPEELRYAQHVYPKHIYYGRPRGEMEDVKKKFSLEIHPAYLVAPLAGLATFGLVSKIVKTPVLLELGLVEKEKEKEAAEEENKLNLHQHQHEHHHHKFPGHGNGQGIIGFLPYPYPPYPAASASASASASSSSSSSGSSQQEAAMMNSIVSATQIPIIFGPFGPTTPPTPALNSATTSDRPWWSSFASMIPRLRFGDNNERDER